MQNNDLVSKIINNYHSHYLIPLSSKYKVDTWNEAMREAWKHLSYKKYYPHKFEESLSYHSVKPIDQLHKSELVDLGSLKNIIMDRIQIYLKSTIEANTIDWVSVQNHLEKFMDCLGSINSQQKTSSRCEQNQTFNDIQDSLSTER